MSKQRKPRSVHDQLAELGIQMVCLDDGGVITVPLKSISRRRRGPAGGGNCEQSATDAQGQPFDPLDRPMCDRCGGLTDVLWANNKWGCSSCDAAADAAKRKVQQLLQPPTTGR
jgi:hypothetical protein